MIKAVVKKVKGAFWRWVQKKYPKYYKKRIQAFIDANKTENGEKAFGKLAFKGLDREMKIERLEKGNRKERRKAAAMKKRDAKRNK